MPTYSTLFILCDMFKIAIINAKNLFMSEHLSKYHIHAEYTVPETPETKSQTEALERFLVKNRFQNAAFDNQTFEEMGFRAYTQYGHRTKKFSLNEGQLFVKDFELAKSIYINLPEIIAYLECEVITGREEIINLDPDRNITVPDFKIIQRPMENLAEFNAFQIHFSSNKATTSDEFIEVMYKAGFYITSIPKGELKNVIFTSQSGKYANVKALKVKTLEWMKSVGGYKTMRVKNERVAMSHIQNMTPDMLPPVFDNIES